MRLHPILITILFLAVFFAGIYVGGNNAGECLQRGVEP